jgi:hypothetical protein
MPIPIPPRGRRAAWALAAAGLAAGPACVDPRSELATAEGRLVGAPLDLEHPFAVGVCHTSRSSPTCTRQSGACTGTLVAPNLVLTARHCVDRGRQLHEDLCMQSFLGVIDATQLFVTVHADPYGEGARPEWIRVIDVRVPADVRFCDFDLALLVLEQSVPRAEAAPVWLDDVTDMARDLPAEVAVVGRGGIAAQRVGQRVVVVDDGRWARRVLERLPTLCASDVRGECTVEDLTEPSGRFSPTGGQMLVSMPALPGDSGSGVIDQESLDAGAPRVVAVLAIGTVDEQGRSIAASGVRLSRHRDFLRDGGWAAAAAAGTEPEPWVTAQAPPPASGGCRAGAGGSGGPDGGVGALLLAGAIAARGLGRRRRAPRPS